MSDRIPAGAPAPRVLPDSPNLDWLRKQAKRRLEHTRVDDPAATLAQAQFAIAKEYRLHELARAQVAHRWPRD